VYLHPETLQPRRITVRRTLTDPEGRFETLVPQTTRTAALVVLAPGFAARILRAVVDPERPLQIPVSPHGGTLVLDLTAAGRAEPPAPPDAAVLDHAGAPGWVGVLEQWAEFHGQPTPSAGRWMLPMMEIGPYRLCTAGGESCDEGALQPGGELVLTLPESRPVEEEPAEGVELAGGE
jgi:hypothetical protein